ncbi:autotransporter outer membrane beta-barrel domain-containing protein [Fodinicurvata sediminis]|uniref:autotransporter outer membrane beta-barrel domain-containing protein n=1 Tax=Fodinicurvata sediminis TaxID=1121832 RepID=UPI0003B5B77E|nr:autotransporter outer membrane beta-barrel domain-containing protein [Fodinicurvata sediminis]
MNFVQGLFATTVVLLSVGQSAAAYESRIVRDSDGRAVFEVRIFDDGDGVFLEDDDDISEASWNLTDSPKDDIVDQKDEVIAAIKQWAEILDPLPGRLPAVINVGTYDGEMNAFGDSPLTEAGEGRLLTRLQRVLQGRNPGDNDFSYDGVMAFGSEDGTGDAFPIRPDGPSPLPTGADGFQLYGVVFHELAHALGVMTAAEGGEVDDGVEIGEVAYFLDEGLTLWEAGLRDSNGNPARPGQFVRCDLDDCYQGGEWEDEDATDPFDLTDDTERGRDMGYVTGPHIREVMDGSLPGVPVRLGGPFSNIDDNYMSHSELERSLMSHQQYRNYNTFMEAELAALQDMGYEIDRRNFFGRSIYGSGLDIVNRNGYFRRNASGTAYLPGQYNRATMGLGLHIYGSNNRVVQVADLLTRGAGAAGVRVDGEGNRLVIDSGTRVHALGTNGRGVMFAYGKGHELIQRGEVEGRDIGVSFDFGGNMMGDDLEKHGSYIFRQGEISYDVDEELFPDELKGPLVESYDLTGRVAGKRAAIYISDTALVKQINVMRGARIQGDILSEYDEADGDDNQRLTVLTFGRAPDSRGQSTSNADPDFVFRHDGNIQGQTNLSLSFEGGYTSLNGDHEVYEVEIAEGASLGGNSTYSLPNDGEFRNAGLLAPGNSIGIITIEGNYVQTSSGTLRLEFNSAGESDQLDVTGTGKLDGQLVLSAAPDWYASDWQANFEFDDFVKVGSVEENSLTASAEIHSPTLSLSFDDTSGKFDIRMSRTANAYSQHAASRNARQVGRALDNLSGRAGSDLQPLYQALDFSAADGSEVGRALTQLSPEAYSAMVATSLDREQRLSDMVAAQPLSLSAATLDNGAVQGFAVPMGGGLWQDAEGGAVGHSTARYGVLFGAQRRALADPDWTWGVHGAFVGQSVSVKAPQRASGDTKTFSLGLQAHYQPDERAGPYFHGQLRAGLESGRLERRIRVNGYSTTNRGDWLGFAGGATAGGGYLWRLNETMSAGPVGSLNYTRLSRPGLREDGKDATRLDLSALHHDSLRSSLGLRTSLEHELEEGGLLKGSLQATWDRELLDTEAVQEAAFDGYGAADFDSRNGVTDRNALNLRASLEYEADDSMVVGAHLSSQFLRDGHRSLAGEFSLRWMF